jgi:Holliday junction resolvase
MSNTSAAHDRLVIASVQAMEKQGCTNIRAHGVPGYNAPDSIGKFIPDVTGYKGTTFVVCEAETTEGLSDSHTEDQLRAFHRHATSRSGWLILSVAQADKATAEALLRKLFPSAQNVMVWAF